VANLNWSMTAIGYPAHARSGSRVIAISHMSTFGALRFAEEIGIRSGWMLAEGSQPQLEDVTMGAPTWVALGKLFADSQVVATEGLAHGRLTFAAATPAAGQPPVGGQLSHWAETHHQPWLEVIDNESCSWGGLTDTQLGRLITWFCCQRPFDSDWRQVRIESRTFARLRAGLFDHGWSRNLALVRPERKSLDLWGGVHRGVHLEHGHLPAPGQAQAGLRLRIDLGEMSATELTDRCPLSDDTGKVAPGRFSGLWNA
jgi:hypothetical protein